MVSVLRITDRIEEHYEKLSKAQQRVAQYILKNLTYVALHAASEVGEKAGTSETTVIRFCYSIGLTGYAQLQKEVMAHILEQQGKSTLGNYVSSKEALFNEPELAEKLMHQVSNQIMDISEQIQPDKYKQLTKRIHDAPVIYLVGSGVSRFAIQWLHYTLSILRPNVHLVDTNTVTLLHTLQQIDEHALVIVVSLHRYSKESIVLAKLFQEKDAHIVAITDTNVAPIHPYVNESFVLQQSELSTIDMMPTLIAFMNTIVAGVIANDATYYNEQRKKFDDFQNDFLVNRWS